MKRLFALSTLSLAVLALSGCLEDTSVKPDARENTLKPVVEAFIEYSGPASRWSGPETFAIHINARAADKIKASVLPKTFVSNVTEVDDFAFRAKLTPIAMRNYLSVLAGIVQKTPEDKVRACLSPVKVRFVREDGAVVEKSGCRSLTGWPAEISRATDRIMSSLLLETSLLQ